MVMAAIRSRGNKATELKLASILRRHGITGWRRNWPLPGRPDFVFPKAKLAVFVDGCFWHGCPQHCRMPGSNVRYWKAKVARNRRRDRMAVEALRKQGWRVMRIWEHALRRETTVAKRVKSWLRESGLGGRIHLK